MNLQEIAQDPEFKALPIEEQRKAFIEFDPDFGKLPTAEQDRGISELTGGAVKTTPPQSTNSTTANASTVPPEPSLLDKLKGRGKSVVKAYQDIVGIAKGQDVRSYLPMSMKLASPAARVLGSAVGAGMDLISPIVNPIVDQIITEATFGKGLPQPITKVMSKGAEAWDKFQKIQPEVAEDAAAVGNIASVLPVSRGGAAVAKVGVKPWAGKTIGKVAGAAANKMEKSALDDAVQVVKRDIGAMSRSEKETAVSQGIVKKAGIFKDAELKTSPVDLDIANTVQDVVSTKKTPFENIEAIRGKIDVTARETEMLPKMFDAPLTEDTIKPLFGAMEEAKNNSRVLFGSNKSIENTYDTVRGLFEELLEKEPKTYSGVLNARRNLDIEMKSRFPNIFDKFKGDNVRANALKDVRNAANDFVADSLPEGNPFKDLLHSQSLMYRAIDNISEKAVPAISQSTISRIGNVVKSHPWLTMEIVAGGVLGAKAPEIIAQILTNPLALSSLAMYGTYRIGKAVVTRDEVRNSIYRFLRSTEKSLAPGEVAAFKSVVNGLDDSVRGRKALSPHQEPDLKVGYTPPGGYGNGVNFETGMSGVPRDINLGPYQPALPKMGTPDWQSYGEPDELLKLKEAMTPKKLQPALPPMGTPDFTDYKGGPDAGAVLRDLKTKGRPKTANLPKSKVEFKTGSGQQIDYQKPGEFKELVNKGKTSSVSEAKQKEIDKIVPPGPVPGKPSSSVDFEESKRGIYPLSKKKMSDTITGTAKSEKPLETEVINLLDQDLDPDSIIRKREKLGYAYTKVYQGDSNTVVISSKKPITDKMEKEVLDNIDKSKPQGSENSYAVTESKGILKQKEIDKIVPPGTKKSEPKSDEDIMSMMLDDDDPRMIKIKSSLAKLEKSSKGKDAAPEKVKNLDILSIDQLTKHIENHIKDKKGRVLSKDEIYDLVDDKYVHGPKSEETFLSNYGRIYDETVKKVQPKSIEDQAKDLGLVDVKKWPNRDMWTMRDPKNNGNFEVKGGESVAEKLKKHRSKDWSSVEKKTKLKPFSKETEEKLDYMVHDPHHLDDIQNDETFHKEIFSRSERYKGNLYRGVRSKKELETIMSGKPMKLSSASESMDVAKEFGDVITIQDPEGVFNYHKHMEDSYEKMKKSDKKAFEANDGDFMLQSFREELEWFIPKGTRLEVVDKDKLIFRIKKGKKK